jgi:hypothetical protein
MWKCVDAFGWDCELGTRDQEMPRKTKMTRSASSAAVFIRACSACDGDYEDPERTAWRDGGEEAGGAESQDDNAQPVAPAQRFPVLEE